MAIDLEAVLQLYRELANFALQLRDPEMPLLFGAPLAAPGVQQSSVDICAQFTARQTASKARIADLQSAAVN